MFLWREAPASPLEDGDRRRAGAAQKENRAASRFEIQGVGSFVTEDKLIELTGNIAAIEFMLVECLKIALDGHREPDAALQAMLSNLTMFKEASMKAMPEYVPALDAATKRMVSLLTSD